MHVSTKRTVSAVYFIGVRFDLNEKLDTFTYSRFIWRIPKLGGQHSFFRHIIRTIIFVSIGSFFSFFFFSLSLSHLTRLLPLILLYTCLSYRYVLLTRRSNDPCKRTWHVYNIILNGMYTYSDGQTSLREFLRFRVITYELKNDNNHKCYRSCTQFVFRPSTQCIT